MAFEIGIKILKSVIIVSKLFKLGHFIVKGINFFGYDGARNNKFCRRAIN